MFYRYIEERKNNSHMRGFLKWVVESKMDGKIIRPSISKETIEAVQEILVQRGYMKKEIAVNVSSIDGILGPITRASILAYQADHNIPATGRITRDLIQSMGLDIDILNKNT